MSAPSFVFRVTSQPESQNLIIGDPLTLEVGVEAINSRTGLPIDPSFYEYQWIRDDDFALNPAAQGVDSSTLTIPSSIVSDSGYYYCKVSLLDYRLELSQQVATGINGNLGVGETLTMTPGVAVNGKGEISTAYYWRHLDGERIPGATELTYTLVESDVGKQIVAETLAWDQSGSSLLMPSEPTDVIPLVFVADPIEILTDPT